MSNKFEYDSLLELYIFETLEQLTQLENIALHSELENNIQNQVNEVFRLVHSLKGSSAVMNFKNIVELSHSLEDVLYYIRENNPNEVNYTLLTDIVLQGIDFIKKEITKIQNGNPADSDATDMVNQVKQFLSEISVEEIGFKMDTDNMKMNVREHGTEFADQLYYKAIIFFDEGCEMENVRAYNIIFNLKNSVQIINYLPNDILQNPESAEYIRNNGFEITLLTNIENKELENLLYSTLFVREVKLELTEQQTNSDEPKQQMSFKADTSINSTKHNMISVNISKMDRLMDLVGELVISQSMVVQNPELEGLSLNGFNKASRQLQLVTNEIQDAVMSIRMISLSMTFQKMNRIVRDMNKKLNKEIQLKVIGENTEVDKNIIEHISDPLLHLVRNAADHGIEDSDTRKKAGKSKVGTITLEAQNDGGDVRIIVKDDGKGLDKTKILEKAKHLNLLTKPENEYSDREIYSIIFHPGFSTKERITEFSGRGVGMDVVNKNIEEIGGTIQLETSLGKSTSVIIKIPLTLAIIDGMKIKVGKSIYIVPITAIRESFRISDHKIIFNEATQEEMIMIRGGCYPLLRLNRYFDIPSDITELENGIVVMVENEERIICLFADELLGVQQVVIKALPEYIKRRKDISSCTVIGNGNVSLIIDVPGLFRAAAGNR